MGIAFLIIGLVLLVGSLWLLIQKLILFRRDHNLTSLDKKGYLYLLLGCIGVGLSALFIMLGSIELCFVDVGTIDYFLMIAGSLLFGFCFAGLWTSFFINHFKKEKDEGFAKTIKIVEGCFIALSIVFFLIMMQGAGDYLVYPLYNGIAINGNGIHFYSVATVNDSVNAGGLHIAFYAILILIGFIVAYLLSDHYIAKEYGKHNTLDNLAIWAFIAGIIGARAWYVVGEWSSEFADRVAAGDWMSIFEVWNGGLTIIGGAALGMIVGITYALFRRPYIHIRLGMDMIIPTILLAQFIGRWGNFFNVEVYGAEVSGQYWSWLPNWIYNQMATAASSEGNIVVPLFLIEGLINLAGYFIITKLVPLLWKKHRGLGSLAGCYLIWYGIVRMILEPLRDSEYIMGGGSEGNLWSMWNALVYVVIGALLIIYFTLYDEYNLRERWFHNYEFCKKWKWTRNLGGEKWLVKDGQVIPLALAKQIQEETLKDKKEEVVEETAAKKTTSKKTTSKKEESVSLEEKDSKEDNAQSDETK